MGLAEAPDLVARCNAIRAGVWVGWLSIVAVAVMIATDKSLAHPDVVLALDAGAAVGNLAFALVPWTEWLSAKRSLLLLDLWSAGLLGFVSLLCFAGGRGAGFDLLLFLVVPFLATAHAARRRLAWLGAAAGTFAYAAIAGDLSPSESVLRSFLLAATALLAYTFAMSTREEASRRVETTARVELEHVLIAEAHHRIKNSLQMISDLLLLSRPAGKSGEYFDETAARIKSIAIVNDLLGERDGGSVSAERLLRRLAAGNADSVRIEADPVMLAPADAQRLGIVGNELIANAVRHGAAPIDVWLRWGNHCKLIVEDGGTLQEDAPLGFGLRLVDSIVRHGFDGTFSLLSKPDGGTRAEVTFLPNGELAHSRR